jgi:hypothetical protein
MTLGTGRSRKQGPDRGHPSPSAPMPCTGHLPMVMRSSSLLCHTSYPQGSGPLTNVFIIVLIAMFYITLVHTHMHMYKHTHNFYVK